MAFTTTVVVSESEIVEENPFDVELFKNADLHEAYNKLFKIAAKDAMNVVRLNLFNHVLALFRAKFACNLTIRYPVFRWDSCMGSV